MSEGSAYLDVSVEVLPLVGAYLPSAFRIIGSAESLSENVIRLVVASSEITGHGHILSLDIEDNHSIRTAKVTVIRLNEQGGSGQ